MQTGSDACHINLFPDCEHATRPRTEFILLQTYQALVTEFARQAVYLCRQLMKFGRYIRDIFDERKFQRWPLTGC